MRESSLKLDDGRPGGCRPFLLTYVEHPNSQVYIDNLLAFFRHADVPVATVALAATDASRTAVQAALEDRPRGILGFNWFLDHFYYSDKSLVEEAASAAIPTIRWIVDHPAVVLPYLRANDQQIFNVFLAQSAANYFARFCVTGAKTGWIMSTGMNQASRADAVTETQFCSRRYRCLLPLNLVRMGGGEEEAERKLSSYSDHIQLLARKALQTAQRDLLAPLEDHLIGAGLHPDALPNPADFHALFAILEEIVQVRRRHYVFEIASDFPVHIQSNRYPFIDAAARSAHIELNVGMPETVGRIKDAQAIVSLSHIHDELHNRTMNGINAGAVNIIEDNTIHRRYFTHGENALLFRYDDDSFRRCLELVHTRPDIAYRIGQEGSKLKDDQSFRFAGLDNLLRWTDQGPQG